MSMQWKTAGDKVPNGLESTEFEDWLWKREKSPRPGARVDLRNSIIFPAFSDLPDEGGMIHLAGYFSMRPEFDIGFRTRASPPPEAVQHDIADLASVGAGRCWPDIYVFGTEAFRGVCEAALDAAVQNDVLMDFSRGASQGQGTPAEPGIEGLAVHMQLGVATVRSGMLVTGPVPDPRNLTGTLLNGGGFMHGFTDAERGSSRVLSLRESFQLKRTKEATNSTSESPKAVRIDEETIMDLKPLRSQGLLD
ncbi:hypothetical protein BDV12DRAFT_204390 [Aspergillus spectabilis]